MIGAQATEAEAEVIETFYPILVDTNQSDRAYLVGNITSRTPLNLERVLERFPSVRLLVLASDGGDVSAGLTTARIVNRESIDTMIPSGEGCYSACSFIFFAGRSRDPFGSLGVHQTSSSVDSNFSSQITTADILDVLTDFEVPNEVFVKMFSTPPDSMYIFTYAELERLGLVGDRSSATARAEPLPNVNQDIEAQAMEVVEAYNRIWSMPNRSALVSIENFYGAEVLFYGNYWTRGQVMNEKRQFAQRWPIRNYAVEVPGRTVLCSPVSCEVDVVVRWEASSSERQARSNGRATFSLVLELEEGALKITSENGQVISRN